MRTTHSRPVRSGVALAVALLPLMLSSTAQTVSTANHAVPRARAGAQVAQLPPAFSLTSRSATRFALLEQVDPETVLLALGEDGRPAAVKVSGPKGTRIWTASAMDDHDIPSAALRAYKNAARAMASTDPSCRIPWTLLAGIGRVESDHGRYGGSVLASDGVSHPLIIGIPLDGAGPVAAIADTDNGRLDHDKTWDRAVGPMQFIPSTWRAVARDGDGDGVASPNDIDDAALAAASYLCSGSGSIAGGQGMASAIYRYNQSDYYVKLVMAFEKGYRTGVFVLPSPPAPEDVIKHKRHKKHRPAQHRPKPTATSTTAKPTTTKPATTTTKPSTSPKPSPTTTTSTPTSTPKPTPSPSPTPTPTGPTLSALNGPLEACGDGFCVGATHLGVGDAAQLARTAAHDYDGDGTVETNAEELAGLVAGGTSVALQVEVKADPSVVYVIDGADYRFADGSFA